MIYSNDLLLDMIRKSRLINYIVKKRKLNQLKDNLG